MSNEELAKFRVDNMQAGSTVYNHYKAVPLNELTDPVERLMKVEIMNREKGNMVPLEEGILDEPASFTSLGPVSHGSYKFDLGKYEAEKQLRIYNAQQAAKNLVNNPHYKAGLAYDQVKRNEKEIPLPPEGVWSSMWASITAWAGAIFAAIGAPFKWVYNSLNKFHPLVGKLGVVVMAAACIAAVALIWKWLKNRKEKENISASNDYADITNTAEYAIFQECVNGTDALCLLAEDSDPEIDAIVKSKGNKFAELITRHAVKMADKLLKDPEFVSYMKREKPEILGCVKKYHAATSNLRK
jgi:hypothetical protein